MGSRSAFERSTKYFTEAAFESCPHSCFKNCLYQCTIYRGGSRTTARSKWELFVTIVNGWKPLTHKGLHLRLNRGSRSTSDLVLLFLFFMPNYFPTHSPWPILERDCKGCNFCEKGQEIAENFSKDLKTFLGFFVSLFSLSKHVRSVHLRYLTRF